MYDQKKDTFVYFPDFDELLRSDRPLASYFHIPSPIESESEVFGYVLRPAVLASRECVECFANCTIFRTESSLKYLAAKALFQARPNLRSEMSAEEFKVATGIEGMEAHFDR